MKKAPRAKLLYLHYGLTLLIMFGFGFLPALAPITPYGMRVVGIFIGAVYGWTFTDSAIPSILGILAMGLLDVLPIVQITAGGFGSPVVWFTILLILLTNVLEELGITEYIALWAMSRKYLNGHPWILSCTFLIVAYFLGAVNPIAAMFVLWGILYQICQKNPYSSLSSLSNNHNHWYDFICNLRHDLSAVPNEPSLDSFYLPSYYPALYQFWTICSLHVTCYIPHDLRLCRRYAFSAAH